MRKRKSKAKAPKGKAKSRIEGRIHVGSPGVVHLGVPKPKSKRKKK